MGNPSGQQLSQSAFNTVLDGNSLNRVLLMRLTENSNLKISSLTLPNGSSNSEIELGAGLNLIEFGFNGGNVTIDKVAFVNNSVYESGALYITEFNRIIFSNCLFTLN